MVKNRGTAFDVCLSEEDEDAFLATLTAKGVDAALTAFSNIDCKSAQATDPKDLENISCEIERLNAGWGTRGREDQGSGFDILDTKVVAKQREWARSTVASRLAAVRASGQWSDNCLRLLLRYAQLLNEHGLENEALIIVMEGLALAAGLKPGSFTQGKADCDLDQSGALELLDVSDDAEEESDPSSALQVTGKETVLTGDFLALPNGPGILGVGHDVCQSLMLLLPSVSEMDDGKVQMLRSVVHSRKAEVAVSIAAWEQSHGSGDSEGRRLLQFPALQASVALAVALSASGSTVEPELVPELEHNLGSDHRLTLAGKCDYAECPFSLDAHHGEVFDRDGRSNSRHD